MVTPVAVRMYDPKAVGTYELSLAELKTHCFPPENPFVSMAMLSNFLDCFLWIALLNFIKKKELREGGERK